MTRTEAEHLLDAYVLMGVQSMPKAKEALRAVILDAMTSTTYYPYTSTTYYPYITSPKPWPYPQVSCTTATNGEVDAW